MTDPEIDRRLETKAVADTHDCWCDCQTCAIAYPDCFGQCDHCQRTRLIEYLNQWANFEGQIEGWVCSDTADCERAWEARRDG